MNNRFTTSLNTDQRRALLSTDGPNLILAGAGSGKTRVLTHKVAYLIEEKKVNPSNILMVTFTNKASLEMKERISVLLTTQTQGGSFRLPHAGTFHALSAKILRMEGEHIGIPRHFSIFDDKDSLDLIKSVMKDLDISTKQTSPYSVSSTISEIKNELITPLEYKQYAKGYYQETVSTVYTLYQKHLKDNAALDFDDLLFEVVKLFKMETPILGKYQNMFQYILVDEYQDTNTAQYTLTKLLASRYRNITVVGDASQSIYGWRGANYRNITTFQEDYPDVSVFHLEQNYRSTQIILDAAYSVISKNTSHPILKLWTDKSAGEHITLYEARNEHDEVEYFIREMNSMISRDSSLSFSSFVILYRTNAQSRVIEEVFLHTGIPYTLVGGLRFYDRKEVKDILSYLRIISNPKDSVNRKRIEKLGKRRMEHFLLRLQDFEVKDKTTLEILDFILSSSDYLSIYDEANEEDRTRLENIKELRSVATEFPELLSFLENVSLVEHENIPDASRTFNDRASNAVTLMTMHAAKGLEFPIVFIMGMEDGLFPHSRTLLDREQLEEERRLCYVGITRAMKKLYLTYASHRLFFGQHTSNVVSQFILELPQELLKTSVASYDSI